MAKQVFDMYSDSGHGWLKVKIDLLQKMGITDKITYYSYEKGEYAYLEEDSDLSTFYHDYEDKFGVKIKFREHYSECSKIRRYPSYNKNKHVLCEVKWLWLQKK